MGLLKRGDRPVTAHEAVTALAECPPPWLPIDRNQDEVYRQLVDAFGPVLLERAQTRPGAPAWFLVRYLPDPPVELVESALASFKRETDEFCELFGGTPDIAAAATWEKQWRASQRNGARFRRAAS